MTLRLAAIAAMFAFSSAAFAADAPALWKRHCKSCHGEDGKAQTKTGKEAKIEDMTTAEWQAEWTDAKMKTIILEGSKKDGSKMKAFKDKLKPDEVDALIAHTRAFKK